MANYTPKQTFSGDEMMIFYQDKSIAWATSHSLSISASTTEINTKDNGKFNNAEVSKISHELSTENLYSEDFDTLFNLMLTGEPITLKFGLRKSETGYVADGDVEYWLPSVTTGDKYFEAKYIITSLEINAATGERTTASATFTGVGKIEQKTVA